MISLSDTMLKQLRKNKLLLLYVIQSVLIHNTVICHVNIVICTAADSLYFEPLVNLIGSIHKVNFENLEQIAVYDLGLSSENKNFLNTIAKVQIYSVPMTNPDLLKPVIINNDGKTVPGWYAWKPVIIKQMLNKYPVVLYLDAGNTVLQSLDELFQHIEQIGYFLVSVFHNIKWSATKFVIEQFDLHAPEREFVLKNDTLQISANMLGFSRKMYERIVLPMFNLTQDMRYFIDDGTSPNGFSTGRQDQTLWSIFAYLEGFEINKPGWSNLKINDTEVPFHTHWSPSLINKETTIYQSRWNYKTITSIYSLKLSKQITQPYFAHFIRYKSTI